MRGSAVSGQNGTRGRALRAVLPASDMRGWARAPLPRTLRRARRPRPSHQGQKWGHAGETGPCGSSPRAFERTADPKLAKVCAITHALELDSRLRLENTRQIVCALRALPSPWILKRILLAIFNIRGRAKRARGLSRGPLAKGFRVRAGRGDGCGLHAGVFCQVELSKRGPLLSEHQHAGMPAARGTGAPRASRQCKAICRAQFHSSESQNEEQACIGQQERVGAIRHFKKK